MTGGPRTSLALVDLLAAAPEHWARAAPEGSAARSWLDLLAGGLDREADLSAYGRFLARTDLLRSARAMAELAWVKVGRRDVTGAEAATLTKEGPPPTAIVIGGLPRTGTTLLQALAAKTTGTWVPRTWEYDRPALIGAQDGDERDLAVAESTQRLAGFARLVPGFEAVHPMAADAPEECDALFAHGFESFRMLTYHDLPTYRSAWLAADHRRCYSLLSSALERRPGAAFGPEAPVPVLKAPGHVHGYRSLRRFIPGAVVVQVHRPVAVVLGSWVDLVHRVRSAFSTRVADRELLMQEWLDVFSSMVDQGIAARRVSPDGWIGLRYEDLVADPEGSWVRVWGEAGQAGSAGAGCAPRTTRIRPIHHYDREVPPGLQHRLTELDERYRSLVFG